MAVETTQYIAMLDRMIRAGGKRVAVADEWELAEFLSLYKVMDEAVQAAVTVWRAKGRSWAYIASATGTTRQAAQQRWGVK